MKRLRRFTGRFCDFRAGPQDVLLGEIAGCHRFADWIRFADGMSVKLRCHREALDMWWQAVSARAGLIRQDPRTFCEVFK
jgi:hypothetical protein